MTSIVTLVPLEHARSYFAGEIASEGRFRSGVPVIPILPARDAGRPCPPNWFPDLYVQMRQARNRAMPKLYRLRDGKKIDVGIIDITIALHVPDEGMIPHLIESETFTRENLDFLDCITAEKICPPMVFATAFHNYHSNGSHHYHFHNLIFGLRKEISEPDGKESIGTIDLLPLIEALNEWHDQNIVAGRKS